MYLWAAAPIISVRWVRSYCYHERMPVILRLEDYETWLDAGVHLSKLLTPLLRPYAHEEMTVYAVSALVNSPSNDGPRCVEPLPDR